MPGQKSALIISRFRFGGWRIGFRGSRGSTWRRKDLHVSITDFCCDCGRIQRYAPENVSGGCTVEEAEAIGWRMIDGKWVCPFCCGNTDALRKIFNENYGY